MFIDIMFMIDIVVNFNTGFYDKGLRIMKRGPVCREYFRWWFWVDFISSFPYTWVFAWANDMDLWSVEDASLSEVRINPALTDAP